MKMNLQFFAPAPDTLDINLNENKTTQLATKGKYVAKNIAVNVQDVFTYNQPQSITKINSTQQKGLRYNIKGTNNYGDDGYIEFCNGSTYEQQKGTGCGTSLKFYQGSDIGDDAAVDIYDANNKLAAVFYNGTLDNVKEKTVDLNLAGGNQTVQDGYYQYQESPVDVPGDINYYFSKVIINKPATLVASNIKSGVNIAGVNGSYEFKTQDKTFTPTQAGGSVTADSGYDGLGVVTVNPVPLGNKTDVPLNFYNQNTGTIVDTQNIYSDSSKFMTWASVARPATLVAANIKKDVNIGGVVGTYEGVILPTYNGLLRFASAPTISLSNSTLTITAVDNATSYAIYSNNALLTTITTTSVDLSTLITTAGTYTIYVIAKATGYVDSEKSNEVSYTVQPSGYNLTINYHGSFGSENFDAGNIYIWLNKTGSASGTDYDVSLTSAIRSSTYTSPNKTESSTEFGDLNGTDSFTGIKYIYIRCRSTEAGDSLAKLNGETLNISSTPLKVDITQASTLDITVIYTD